MSKINLNRLFAVHMAALCLWQAIACAASAESSVEANASNLAQTLLKDTKDSKKSQSLSSSYADERNIDERTGKVIDDKTQFEIQKVVVQDSANLPITDFDVLTKPFLNTKITLKDATELARAIENEYRRKGFLTTLVFVPPQTIEGKTLTIQVVDGLMGDLYVEGNRYFSAELIKSYWMLDRGEKVEAFKMLSSLRYANSNQDRQVRAILKPGKEKGLTDVYLKVEDRQPLHFSAGVDNMGHRNSGRYRPMFIARHNNFLIPDSTYLIGTALASHFGALFTQYIVPLDKRGTQLILGFTASQVAPKRDFKEFDINGIAQVYSAAIRRVFMEGESFISHIQLGFDAKDTRTQTVDGLSRRERLRIVNTQIDYQSQDALGTWMMTHGVAFGIDGLGASDDNNPFSSRDNTNPDFVRFSGQADRTINLSFGQVALRVDYQLATDRLPSSEQMFMGGMNSVRGYPESDYLADQGIGFSAEYLATFAFLNKDIYLFNSKKALKDQLQWLLFFDEAYGRNRFTQADEIKDRHLLGVGGGVRYTFSDNVSTRFEIGHALGDEPLTESDHTRFHFKIQVQY